MGTIEMRGNGEKGKLEKSYIEVVAMCCSSEVPLIEKILKSFDGVVEVSVIVPSRTVIVLHDSLLVSQLQMVKALNQAKLEANIKVSGKSNFKGKWPSPFMILSGILFALSLLKYVYHPLEWFAILAVAVGIWPIFMRFVIAIKNFTLDANVLMFLAVVSTLVLRDFTEAAAIVFLFTLSEWLGMRASYKATAVMSTLMGMAPLKATIAETGEVINVEDVELNTILCVKSGEIIPVDGMVVKGSCEVDEKTLTGESFPVPKTKGATVRAGTVNLNGYVEVETTALAKDSTVAKMAKLVEEAQSKKSSVQRLIDTIAMYYTPVVFLTAIGLAAIPAILKVHNLSHWYHLALVVLVGGCPCSLILSTPVATFCALSRAATSGLLIKGGDYLETLAKLKFIAFDKTGTLTRGEFTVKDFHSLSDDVSLTDLLYWVSSIESKSGHPIAAVLVEYARSNSVEPKPENVEDFQDFPGEGVSGKIDGKKIFVGNRKLGERANHSATSSSGSSSKEIRTSGYIYCGGIVIGTFSLSDNCRAGAKEAIRDLKSMNIRTALLTGDCQSAAMHAQEQLGQALDIVHAELMPQDKAKIIQDYKNEGTTAMVGDGVNDAPALITADIGISMGVSGTALANEASHVVLMSNDIRKIPKAIKLARRTRWKVMENIIFSIVTKVAVLALAVAGHPLVWLAVGSDLVTCFLVILNSMTILRGKHGKGHEHGHKHGHEHGHGHVHGKKKCDSHKSHCNSSCEGIIANSCDASKACDIACCEEDHCIDDTLETKSCCIENSKENETSCCGNEKSEHHVTIHKPCDQTNQEEITPIDDVPHTERNGSKCPSHGGHHHHHVLMNDHSHHEHKSCFEGVAQKSGCGEKGKTVSSEHKGLKCLHSHGTHDHESHGHSHGTHDHESHGHGSHGTHDHESHGHGSHGPCHGGEAKHGCNNLRKREVRTCCRTYRKTCCRTSHSHPHFVPGFGGLTEIVTE